MESKQKKPKGRLENGKAFNRTSMESKLSCFATEIEVARGLLIEPVWNRNKSYAADQSKVDILLIEPVWNRNSANVPCRGGHVTF